MKNAKKIIWIILALLPILPVLFMFISHIGNDTAGTNLPSGTISLLPTTNGSIYITIQNNSWASLLLSPYTGGKTDYQINTGFFANVARFMHFLNTNLGIPINAPMFVGFWYLCYLAIMELLSILVDFIMFIPRKCLQLMN